MESLRRLTSSIFDGESRLSLGRRGSISSGILSPNSEAAAAAAQRFAPSELDLTFITERLIVSGFPVEGPTDKKRNQNNIDDLADYLEMHHSNQFLIFNLNSLEDDAGHVEELDAFLSPSSASASAATVENREHTNAIAEKVRQQMVEFAWERDGMKAHTPPFDHVLRICYAIFSWLSIDAKNVALINCQTGKTRSGIVAASYLLYARLADDPIDAFVEFYRKRWDMKSLTPEALRQKTPQSIQRFLTCFHDLIENQRIPNEKPLMLKGIIIRSVPVEYQPCIQIWDDYRLLYCTSDGPQQSAGCSQPQEGPVIDWDCEDGCLAILWEDGFDLDGGFSVMCSFGDEYDIDESTVDASSKVLFRYADSTWFLAPGLITLTKAKLDMMKQYEEAFNDELFSMDLVFVESKKSRRKYVPIDCTGNTAVRQGVIEITKQHVVLPDPAMHSNFMKMGYSDAATTFALQRSQNAPNIALDLLHSSVISICFKQVTKTAIGRARPALQSYSSSSFLGKQLGINDDRATSQPAERKQTTGEIVALQSQRSRYSTPSVADFNSTCQVCKDDDYMKRPQIVLCTGPCQSSYHTTCVGLKRIPFGLTTLSDRTNHAVYVKKYFSVWVCDSCGASRSPLHQQSQPARTQPDAIPLPDARRPGQKVAERSLQSAHGETSAPNVSNAGDERMDKLREFLAMSGVSVDDLLKAATTANLTISPSATPVELPKVLAPDSEATARAQMSPRSGALSKLFTPESVKENPQDSSPKRDSYQVPALASNSPSFLAEISNRKKAAPEIRDTTPKQPCTDLEDLAKPLADPKSALLAQIAARSKSTEDVSMRGELFTPQSKVDMATTALTTVIDANPNKYQLMLQKGVPFEAVQNCMKKDDVDPSSLTPVDHSLDEKKKPIKSADVTSGTKLKDMSEFSGYFNMLRLGCPQPAVRQKMIMDGADPVVLDLGPDAIYGEIRDRIKIASLVEAITLQDDIKSVKSHKKLPATLTVEVAIGVTMGDPALPKETTLKEHELYSKYFKMLKMGLPEDAVRQKIQRDGLDVRALELGGDAPYSKLAEKPEEIRLADDPTYSKFFKMLKMGLPKDAVHHKMLMEGADARALELGPGAFVSHLSASKSAPSTVTRSPPVKTRRKKLHWQPIANDRLSSANQQTIWEDKNDEGVDFDMDMAEIESLFFASSDNGKKKQAGSQSKTLKRKQSVTLIDGKRAMNAAISLARVKLSYSEIGQAISVFDANGLTVEQLHGIRDFLPTQEEVVLVTNYNGDMTVLGEAEKFILEISKVKRYTVRTECLLFRMSFPSRREELAASIGNLIGACKQVKESRLLKILLSMVLKLGNTLNGSGEENEIRGFAVDSLLRLGHTKAVNQKTTVLHYLVRVVKKNHPAVLDFQYELKSVPLAARESFETVDEDFSKLQTGLTQLSEEFQELQKDEMDAFAQRTVESLRKAVDEIGSQLESLDQSIKRARDEVQSVLGYFGEDPARNASSFFTTLSSFCSTFESARKEVDAADEAALRAERLKMRRNASMRPTGNPSSSVVKGFKITRERAMSERAFLTERIAPRLSENDA